MSVYLTPSLTAGAEAVARPGPGRALTPPMPTAAIAANAAVKIRFMASVLRTSLYPFFPGR
jgi:hypothetical protein